MKAYRILFTSVATVLIFGCNTQSPFSTKELITSLETKNFKQAKKIIISGTECNYRKDHWGPIHIATFKGNFEILSLLVKHGADVNAKGWNWWTPIHIATEAENFKMVKFLLEQGANPNKPCLGRGLGNYPLNLAYKNDKITKILKEYGAVKFKQLKDSTGFDKKAKKKNPEHEEQTLDLQD